MPASTKKNTPSKTKEAPKMTWGSGGLFGNRVLGSLFLILVCPIVATMAMILVGNEYKGSLARFGSDLMKDNIQFLYKRWPNPFDPIAWKLILSYMVFELILMRFVPGKRFEATVAPSGHIPVYNANGFQCYLITFVTVIALGYYKPFGVYTPSLVYDKMPEIISSMNVFALGFCSFLTYKGLNFPSTPDAGTNGNVIVDFFWGTELYPRIFGWDVKQFTNCRFGMMFWQVALICFAFKQYDEQTYLSSSLFASVIIQSVYIAKFFLWETGYFKTMDIQHDRAGYYICWGCLVWVPSMYTIHSHYMVSHPIILSAPMFILVVGLGVFSTWCNYDCDKQRQEFRESDGKIKIWGKIPEFVVAHYKTADGETRSSLLLADGWWAISRHFHYIPEIAASYLWCLPFVFDDLLPNFYPLYLTALLVDRAWRDDARCAAKYKDDWDLYCKKVPYKIIPGII